MGRGDYLGCFASTASLFPAGVKDGSVSRKKAWRGGAEERRLQGTSSRCTCTAVWRSLAVAGGAEVALRPWSFHSQRQDPCTLCSSRTPYRSARRPRIRLNSPSLCKTIFACHARQRVPDGAEPEITVPELSRCSKPQQQDATSY
jgi:hypothetical protein